MNEQDGILNLLTHDHFAEDTCAITLRGDWFEIEINNPWAGDSEVGFGMGATIQLNRADAVIIFEWLKQRLVP